MRWSIRACWPRVFTSSSPPLTAQSGAVREQWDATYKLLTDHGFSRKPVLEGTGTAAGEAYAWAIENPDKVACIYGRNPVLRSLMSKTPPLDNLAPLAKAGVPLLHVCGSLDPWLADQTRVVEKRYKELGGPITVIVKEGEGHLSARTEGPEADRGFHPEPPGVEGNRTRGRRPANPARVNPKDAKHVVLDTPAPVVDEDYQKYAIYEKTAPRPAAADAATDHAATDARAGRPHRSDRQHAAGTRAGVRPLRGPAATALSRGINWSSATWRGRPTRSTSSRGRPTSPTPSST